MGQRKRVTEPIQDDVVVARLAKDAAALWDPPADDPEPVTVNQEMEGKLVLDEKFKQALLLLGLDAYIDLKKANAAHQKDEIDRQLKEDLANAAVIKSKIEAGEF